MNKKSIIAKIRSDGTVVEVQGDKERPLPDTPMRPMTEAEIEAAAAADPEAEHHARRRIKDGAARTTDQDLAPRA